MNQVNLNHCEIHQEMEYIIVCFNSSCDGKRIGCAKCIQDNHHQHPQDCIFIEDIMNEDNGTFNQNPQLKTLMARIKKKQSSVNNSQYETIQTMLEDLEVDTVMNLELQKQFVRDIIEKEYIKLEPQIQGLQNLFNEVFDLSHISMLLERLYSLEITQSDFQDEVKSFMDKLAHNNKRQQLHQNYESMKSIIPHIREEEVSLISNDLQKIIESLSDTIQSHYQRCFQSAILNSPLYNTNLKFSKDMKTAHMNALDQFSYAWGKELLIYPKKYEYTLRLSNVNHTAQQPIYMGLIDDSYKEITTNLFKAGMCVFINLINNGRTLYVNITPNNKILGPYIKTKCQNDGYIDFKIVYDSKNKSFTLDCLQEEYHIDYSYKAIKNQYLETACTQINQLFDREKKLRLFVYTQGATLDVSIL